MEPHYFKLTKYKTETDGEFVIILPKNPNIFQFRIYHFSLCFLVGFCVIEGLKLQQNKEPNKDDGN